VAVAVAVAVGLGVALAVAVAVAVGVTLAVAVGVALAVAEAVGVTVAVAVALALAVAVAVAVAVGVGVPPVVPFSRNTWSGPLVNGRHVVFRAHVGQKPNPPPGFCQAAPSFDCTVRSVQAHAPFGINIMLA